MRFSVVGLSTIAKVGLGKRIGPMNYRQDHGWSLVVNRVCAPRRNHLKSLDRAKYEGSNL